MARSAVVVAAFERIFQPLFLGGLHADWTMEVGSDAPPNFGYCLCRDAALLSVHPPSNLTSSARICSNLRRSVTRFSSKIRVISGLAFKFACACCWSFKSIISSNSFTNVSACINPLCYTVEQVWASRTLDQCSISAPTKDRVHCALAAAACFGLASALAWWGPITNPIFYCSEGLFLVEGEFIALLIQRLPGTERQTRLPGRAAGLPTNRLLTGSRGRTRRFPKQFSTPVIVVFSCKIKGIPQTRCLPKNYPFASFTTQFTAQL